MVTDIVAVTTYFNPCRYATKKANFDLFAARLTSTGARLLVVELALGDAGFELSGDLDVIRLRGTGELWQKERLLNLAVANLPPSCTKVAWVDCDVLFENDAWLRDTSEALERFAVVQPFSTCVRLPRGETEFHGSCQEDEPIVESFASAFARDPSLARDSTYKLHGHTGFAWAARRPLLDACGLYDACLTGSGDHLMAHVFAGALDSRCIPAMIGAGHAYADHFERWGVAAFEIGRGSLGHLPGRLLHLWHGSVSDRRYFWRNQEFKHFAFDPDRHLRRADNGTWEWGDAPADMRAWARELFVSRNEDGAPATPPAPGA